MCDRSIPCTKAKPPWNGLGGGRRGWLAGAFRCADIAAPRAPGRAMEGGGALDPRRSREMCRAGMAAPKLAGSAGFWRVGLHGSGPKGVGVTRRNSAIETLHHRRTDADHTGAAPPASRVPLATHYPQDACRMYCLPPRSFCAAENSIPRRGPAGGRPAKSPVPSPAVRFEV